MIVVAIIGLLAAMILPSFLKSRKQSQGQRIVNDARQMDAAVEQWAMETGQTDGAIVDTVAASSYLKTTWMTSDSLGNWYRISTVGTNQIRISNRTKRALAGVGIDWGHY
jgi:type II secretory pathway pseudopilin PulG